MQFTEDELKVINTDRYQPSVSIVLSVYPGDINYKLRQAENQVNKELSDAYPDDVVKTMQERLHKTITGIDTTTLKKTLVIYVSPMVAQVFDLEITADEKITINESFEIRDLVYARQKFTKFLILLLTGKHAKIFQAEAGHITLLPTNIQQNIEAYENDISTRVANFSDPDKRKEVLLDKLLHHADKELSGILNTNPLPVFVVGPKKEAGHFSRITHNGGQIANTIFGSYDNETLDDLMEVLTPYVKKWEKTKERTLLQQLENAQNASLVDFGIHMVWKTANEKNARLLVVEKNYKYPADYVTPAVIRQHADTTGNTLFVRDAVDDVIEKVISDGGEVRFVDDGMLDDYLHIALIRYF